MHLCFRFQADFDGQLTLPGRLLTILPRLCSSMVGCRLPDADVAPEAGSCADRNVVPMLLSTLRMNRIAACSEIDCYTCLIPMI